MENKNALIFIFVVIVLVVAIIVITSAIDTGDFSITYKGNSKKYENIIKSGINRWSSIGTGGVHITFSTYSNPGTNVIADTCGSTIRINEEKIRPSTGSLVIAHEVGHVLGIGVGWGPNDTTKSIGGVIHYLSDDKYPKTAAAFRTIRPATATAKALAGPPLYTTNGGGSDGSTWAHWENSQNYGMGKDIMRHTISSSHTVISIVDLTYLEEIGRTVDVSQAENLSSSYFNSVTSSIYGDEEIKDFCGNCSRNKNDI